MCVIGNLTNYRILKFVGLNNFLTVSLIKSYQMLLDQIITWMVLVFIWKMQNAEQESEKEWVEKKEAAQRSKL